MGKTPECWFSGQNFNLNAAYSAVNPHQLITFHRFDDAVGDNETLDGQIGLEVKEAHVRQTGRCGISINIICLLFIRVSESIRVAGQLTVKTLREHDVGWTSAV